MRTHRLSRLLRVFALAGAAALVLAACNATASPGVGQTRASSSATTAATTTTTDQAQSTQASATQSTGTPLPTTHTDAECNPSLGTPWQGQPGTFTEVQGTATTGEFWALVFQPLPLQAGDVAKIVWKLGGPESSDTTVTLLAEDTDGNRIGPLSPPNLHLSSTWGRPGTEWGSIMYFPHAGCWQVRATAGTDQGTIWFAVEPQPASASAPPGARAGRTRPLPRACRLRDHAAPSAQRR